LPNTNPTIEELLRELGLIEDLSLCLQRFGNLDATTARLFAECYDALRTLRVCRESWESFVESLRAGEGRE